MVNEGNCSMVEDKEAEFIYTPIVIAIALYIILALPWIIYGYFSRRNMNILNRLLKRSSVNLPATISHSLNDSKEENKVKERLRSLDTVRGISIVVMIFVNYGGGKYWFFDHSLWNGLTVADLVFPWFIWMMGMSMALSLRSLLRKSISHRKILFMIAKRSVILFALGIMLNTYCLEVNLEKLRVPGVLQRFSISYFVVASIHLLYARAEKTQESFLESPFRDVLIYWVEWVIMIGFLTTHLLLTFLLHAPGCPSGYLGPGGLHDEGNYSLCTGGAAGYIDRMVLGSNHLYQYPTFKVIYQSTLTHDPEGILGYLTSIFLVFLGLQAGKILLIYKDPKPRILRWLAWSVLTGSMALILTKASQNDGWIPINKNLWSISFILATGSLAFMLMSLCYYVIDVKKWWTGTPFYHSGMNSILLYVGHSMTHNMFPWSWKVQSTHGQELAIDLWGTFLWVLISVWMYYIKFFVTV